MPPCLDSRSPLGSTTPMYTPSTLKPAEVAVALVEQAVAKHNTRLDKTFFKAVSNKYAHVWFNISILLLGSCRCYVVLRWSP
ncbi:uncharacterized protein BJ212DRAFT_1383722 [Suillus subaureus]|uniref:Uncharacterized protein n=1 Tax=Suillus subaureus TaxID=48587 RepID=A0A9P7E1D8_9AGAM|nr:uncharacterized protein BJ212DRAFT_1383722 [Suillus subaureus]KAG1808169.1 hypothetical protein BJ212DRAFT_1383722 [Suillus subaureus]